MVVVLLICGLVHNANRAEEEVSEEEKEFTVVLGLFYDDNDNNWVNEDGEEYSYEVYTVKNTKSKLNELIEFLGDDFDSINILGNTAEDAKNGPIYTFATGIYSSDFEYFSEELKEFCNSKEKILRFDPYAYKEEFGKVLEPGDKVDINGQEYVVSITEKNVACIDIPYAAVQDKFVIKTLFIELKDVCTAERNEEIERKISELFGNKEITAPVVRDLQEEQDRNLVDMVTVAVVVMILLNISRVYSYILTYRKKSFAVMGICGASKLKIFIIYLVELMFTLAATFGIGVLVFNTCILQPIGNMYPSILEFMTPSVYMTVFEIYIVAAFIIMSATISIFISRTSVDMERG